MHYPNCTGNGYSSTYRNNSYYYHSSNGNFSCRAYGNFTIERLGNGGSLTVYADFHNCYLPTMSPISTPTPTSTFTTVFPTPVPNFVCSGRGNLSTIEGYGDFNLIFSHYPNCTGNGYSSTYRNNSYYYHSSNGNFSCRAYGNFTIERLGNGGSLTVFADFHNCYLPMMSPISTPTPTSTFATVFPTPIPNFVCNGRGNLSTIEGYGDFNLIFSHYPNCTGNGYSSTYRNNSYYYHSSNGNFSCRAYGNFTIERIGYGGSLNVDAEYHNCYLPTMSPASTPTPISTFTTVFPTPIPNFVCNGRGNLSTIEGYGDFNLIFSHYPNCTGNGYSSTYRNNSYYYHSSNGNFSCRAYGNFTIERLGNGGSLTVYADFHNCYLPTMSPISTPTPTSTFATVFPTPVPNFVCSGRGNLSTIEGYGDFNLIFSHYPNCTGNGYSSTYRNNSYYYHSSNGNFSCRAYGNFTIERLGNGGSLTVYADFHNCYLPTMSPISTPTPTSTFATVFPTPIPNFVCNGRGNLSTIEGYGDFNLIFSHYPNCTGNGYSSTYRNNSYYYHSSNGNFSCRAYGNFTIERIGYGGSLNVDAEYHNCYLPTMSPTSTPTPISTFTTVFPTPIPNFVCNGRGNLSTIEGYGDFNLIFSHYPNCTGNGYSSTYRNNSYYYHSSNGNFSCRAYGNFTIERLGNGGSLTVYADFHNCYLPTMSPISTPTPTSTFTTVFPTPVPNFVCSGRGNLSTIEGYGDFNLIFSHYPNCTGNGYSSTYRNNSYYYHSSNGNFSCRAYGNFTIERLGNGGSLTVYADFHNCYLPTMSPISTPTPTSTFTTVFPTPVPNFVCSGRGNLSTIEGYGDFNLIFSHYPNCTGNGYSSTYRNNSYYYHSSNGNFSCRAYGNFTIERLGNGGSLTVYADFHNCYLPTMSPISTPTPTSTFATVFPTPIPNFVCNGRGNLSTIEGYGDFNLIFSHYPNCTGNGYSSTYRNNSYYYHSSNGNFSCRAYGNFTIERIGYGGSLNVDAEYHNCYLPTMSPTSTPTPISTFTTVFPTPIPNFVCNGRGNLSTIEGYGDFNLIFSHYPNCTGNGYSSTYRNNSYYYHSSNGNFSCRAYGNFTIERLGNGGSLTVYADFHNCYLPTMSPISTPTPTSTFTTVFPTPVPNFVCSGRGNLSTIEGYGDFNLIFSHYPNCTGNGYSSTYRNNSYYYHSSNGNFSCRAYGNFTIERLGNGGSLTVYADFHNCYLPTMSPISTPTPTSTFTTVFPTPVPNFVCSGRGNLSTIEGYGDFNLIFSHYPNCTGNGYSSTYHNNSYYYHSSNGNFSCRAYGNFTIERLGNGGSLTVYADFHNCYLPTMSPISTPTPTSTFATVFPTPIPNFVCNGRGNLSTIEGYGDFNLIFSHYPNCTGNGYSSTYRNNSYYYHSSNGNFSCRAYGNFTIERIGYGGSLNVDAEYHNCYLPTMSPASTPTPISTFTTVFPTPIPNFVCNGRGNLSTIEGYGDFNLVFSHYPNCTGNGYSSTYRNNSYYYHSSNGNFSCRAYGNFTIERLGNGGSLNVYADFHNCYLPTMSPISTPTPTSTFTTVFPTPVPNFVCNGRGNLSTIEGYGDFNLIFSHYPNCTGNGYSSTYRNNSYYYHSSNGNFSCRAYGNFTIERIGYGGSLNVDAEYHNCYLPTMSPISTPTPISTFTTVFPTPIPNFVCNGRGNLSTIEGYGDFNLVFSHYPNCTGNGYSSTYRNNSYYYHSSNGNFSCRAYGNFTIERLGNGGSLNVYADFHNCYLPTMSPISTPTPTSTFTTVFPTPVPNFVCNGRGNLSTIEGYGDFNLIFSHYPNCTGNGYSSTYRNNSYYYHSNGNFSCRAYGNFTIERIGYGGSLNVDAEYHNCYLPTMSPTSTPTPISTFTTVFPTPVPNFVCNGRGNLSTIEGYSDFNLIFSHYPNCTGNGYSSTYRNNSYYYHSSNGNFSCRAYGNFTIERLGNGGSLNVYADFHNCYLPTMSPISTPTPTSTFTTVFPTPIPNFVCNGRGNSSTIEGYGDFNLMFSHYPNCTGNGYSSSYGNNSYYYHSSNGNFSCRAYGNFTIERLGNGGSLSVYAEYHNCYFPTMSPTPTPIPNFTCNGGSRNITILGSGYFRLMFDGNPSCVGAISSFNEFSYIFVTNGSFFCDGFGNFTVERIQPGGVLNVDADFHNCFFSDTEISCFASDQYEIVGNGVLSIIPQLSRPFDCISELLINSSDSNARLLLGEFICSGNGFVQITGIGDVFVNSTGYTNCTGTNVLVDDTPVSCSGSGVYRLSGIANATIVSLDELTCSGQVALLSDQSNEANILYYVGGYYICNGNGFFTISGYGYATIDVANGSHTCTGPQPILCATFNIAENGGVSVVGDGEYTIIGDDSLYCYGNTVLCPGEINYYFTNGRFYCAGDLFAHIDGVGVIENITGNNNCSGFGFAVPPPIFSGTPLTPQPVCIGYGSAYSIRGTGPFNTSRLLGMLNCDSTLQEVTSDVATYFSYEESFSCNGTGIFFFEGMGSSEINVDNDGFFNCIDATPLVPLFCVGDGFGVVEGIGNFTVASRNASCRNRNTNAVADNLYINGSVGDVFSCQFNYPFEFAGTGIIFNMMGADFQCNNSRQYCEASGNFTFNATGNLYIRIRTGGNIMCTDESSNSLTFESSTIDNTTYINDGSVMCSGNGLLSINGTGIILRRMSDERFACNAELIPTTTTVATATTSIVTSTPTLQTVAVTATVVRTVNTVPTVTTTPTLATVISVTTNPTVVTVPTITTISTVTPMISMATTTTTTTIPTPTVTTTTLATTTITSTTTSVSSATTTSVTASVTPVETVSGNR